jgi:hypothetical protein
MKFPFFKKRKAEPKVLRRFELLREDVEEFCRLVDEQEIMFALERFRIDEHPSIGKKQARHRLWKFIADRIPEVYDDTNLWRIEHSCALHVYVIEVEREGR